MMPRVKASLLVRSLVCAAVVAVLNLGAPAVAQPARSAVPAPGADLDAALRAAQAGASTSPDAASSRTLALVHVRRNEIAAARRVIAEGLERWPDAGALLEARGQLHWRLLHTASAIADFEKATGDPLVAADAYLGLGRIAMFRGWQSEGAFPGWHEEVDQRAPAIAALRRSAELRPGWADPLVVLGDLWLLDGKAGDARTAFDRALAAAPADRAALSGRARAAAGGPSAPTEAGPEQTALAGIDAALKMSQPADAASRAQAFIRQYPFSARLLEAYDRLLAAYQNWPEAALADILAALDARVALRPDPAAYYAGAHLLLARKVELDRVRTLAQAGAAAGERFILENRPSYKLEGKVQASRDRNQAAAADLAGWAAYLQNDRQTAATRLEEAARLSNGLDALNQFHRAELARAAGDAEVARERYYDALSLQAGPPTLREAARTALADVYASDGTPPAEAARTIDRELERRREERRRALVSSAIGRTLPTLPTTDVAGTPVDLLAERGNVTLLNFFASW